MKKDILWLIAARSGSKGIPNKNIKELNEIPLIAYKIKTALSISKKENIWVSTDSNEYAEIAKEWGAHVPFLRPAALSQDDSSSMDLILHAMQYAESIGKEYRFIGLLEPTSPFVYYKDILNAINILESTTEAKSIIAVKETRPNSFFIQEASKYLDQISERINKTKSLGRQNFNKEITPSGGFYISKWNDFLKEKSFYTKKTIPYIVADECSLEIDEPIDWLWAEFLLKNKIIDLKRIYK